MIRRLKRRERARLMSYLRKRYGFEQELDYHFFWRGKSQIRICTPDLAKADLKGLHIQFVGLEFARLWGKEIRLSVEGSQLVGVHARRGVLRLDERQCRRWMTGRPVRVRWAGEGFAILRCGDDFVGASRCREGHLVNYLPRWRRLRPTGGKNTKYYS